jgi:hypothetical protein
VRLAVARPEIDHRLLRRLSGGYLLLVFAFGLASFWKPEWSFGDVTFRDVTAGGDLGRGLTGSPLGVATWIAVGLVGAGLIWPQGARLAGQGALAFGRKLASLELHLTIWRGIRSFLTSLVPRSEEASDKLLDKPYVAQYDEDWLESEAEEPTAGTASASMRKSKIVVTGELDEDLDAYQRPLPMGRRARHG